MTTPISWQRSISNSRGLCTANAMSIADYMGEGYKIFKRENGTFCFALSGDPRYKELEQQGLDVIRTSAA